MWGEAPTINPREWDDSREPAPWAGVALLPDGSMTGAHIPQGRFPWGTQIFTESADGWATVEEIVVSEQEDHEDVSPYYMIRLQGVEAAQAWADLRAREGTDDLFYLWAKIESRVLAAQRAAAAAKIAKKVDKTIKALGRKAQWKLTPRRARGLFGWCHAGIRSWCVEHRIASPCMTIGAVVELLIRSGDEARADAMVEALA